MHTNSIARMDAILPLHLFFYQCPPILVSHLFILFDLPPINGSVVREEELKRIVLITRLLNMGVSIAVITMSILTAIGGFKDPKIIILALYSTCGGCLICCLETQLKFFRTAIAMNFGFLFNAGFRFMFYILIASVCYAFQSLFGYIMFGFMLATAFYNTYVLMKYPAYKQLRDKLAAEEDERIQMNLRAEGAKMAAKQMFSK
jgi:hypothetical protein